MAVPVVLAAAVGIGAKRFADDTVGALHLGVGVLGNGEPTMRVEPWEPMLLMKARNTSPRLACGLGFAVHCKHVGTAGSAKTSQGMHHRSSSLENACRQNHYGLMAKTTFYCSLAAGP